MSLFSERPCQVEFGRQTAIAESDNVLVFHVRGLLNGDEARGLQQAAIEYGERFGYFDLFADVSQLKDFDSAARRVWVNSPAPYAINTMYMIGATFSGRTVIWAIYRAGRVLKPSHFTWTMEWYDTEEDARTMRAKRIAEAAKKSVNVHPG